MQATAVSTALLAVVPVMILLVRLAPAAQQVAPPRRIAVVFGRSPLDTMVGPQPSNPGMRAFLEGLRDLGYVDGGNIVIERRALEGRMEQVPTVIHDLLRLKVEVILAAALDVAVATQRITATVPIVVVDATYEGRDRIVESLTRPGGNVTGLGNAGPTLSEKRLALIKETLPRASQVTILTEPLGSWSSDAEVRAMGAAAERLRLRLSWAESQEPRPRHHDTSGGCASASGRPAHHGP